ncbi:MAG: glycoside hydrolase family 3 C-terminal domain-containing protein [Methylacidiphilales bacterium]|nr:glycoside hydrolase family 3 C-terminal domain-containing protein [Candidatus Methylacidiphilales bacterium]
MDLYLDRSQPSEKRAADLLRRLSLPEKIGQLNQKLLGWKCYRRTSAGIELTEEFQEAARDGNTGAIYGLFRADPWSGVTYGPGLLPADGPKVANAMQRFVVENSRWKIPLLFSEECPHGHMALDGTLFPTNIGSACSWNPALYERAMQMAAREIRACGGNLGLVSVLDVARDPRWGRTEETLGEDPYLISQFAAAAVRGLQGDNTVAFGPDRVAAVVKHAIAQGEALGGHNTAPAPIGEREVREIHLPPLHTAFQAGAGLVMAAYNEIDGLACISNRKLLTDLFRNELGFRGVVMADGVAVDRLTELMGVSLPEAAAFALRAGVDLSLWDRAYTHLEEAFQRGLVKIEEIDAAAERILTLKFRLGIYDQPYLDESIAVTTRGEADRAISLELARESLVLLKNDQNLLPFSRTLKRIAVLGPNADHIYNMLGDYTAPQRDGQVITLLRGIREAASSGTEIVYHRACSIRNLDRSGLTPAIEAAKNADVTVLCLGGASTRDFGAVFESNGAIRPGANVEAEMECGEGVDSASLRLPGLQEELFRLVAATGTPAVVVLIQGRPYAIPELARDANAILAAWYPGQEGGRAVAEALFGDFNPSGKLSISVPRSEAQLPVYYNHKPAARLDYSDMPSTPLYPFGFGLSYTRFAYRDLAVEPSHQSPPARFTVSVTVQNVGDREGAEVVQLYLRDKAATIVRRVAELKGFLKITLRPNEDRRVIFDLGPDELGLWNAEMQWVVEPGEFIVRVGGDSTAPLTASFTVDP